ncbi:probable palmitoyltransferase ZDHHC11B isoform X1 [Rhinolophus ferrumequinum]|uniref:probable palmitoyltransferase ZDHHC11B isoform X1 n=1 Tax=Rhinolophus ferrumequinum TaxID=59479 RepID=UPI00140F609E|nr:probable palmitoyltransferase ZDHHC11B isoform X1 [Rhinolophus ferrumequinum]
MGCCCRGPRPIVPDTVPRIVTDVAPPRWSRVNGWSKPFDPFQVVVWAIFLTFVLAMFCVFIPMLPCEWQYVTYAVTSGGFVLHYIAYVTAMTIDPAEASVRCKIYGAPRPSFDRARQAHVIQDQYCSLCDAIVSMKAKHCRMCNKCVAGFDHHCKWMNNCVGSRNYWWFFVSIASAFTGLLGIIAIVMYILIQHFINPEALREDPHYGAISSQGTWLLFLPFFPVRTKTLVVVSIEMFVLLLASLCLVVITYLLFFHIYLLCNGLTTLSYVKRDSEQASKASVLSSNLPTGKQSDNLPSSARSKARTLFSSMKAEVRKLQKKSLQLADVGSSGLRREAESMTSTCEMKHHAIQKAK